MSEAALETVRDRYTLAEYFALEEASDERYEFIDGQIIAMATETDSHSVICSNVNSALLVGLKGTPCRPMSPNMQIRYGRKVRYGYADTAVVCGERQYEQSDPNRRTLLNPILIVEVLSGSTEAYVRRDKFSYYREIESLREYVLISQYEPRVETFHRQEDGDWRIATYEGLDARIPLASLKIEVLARDLYADVAFQKPHKKARRKRKPK